MDSLRYNSDNILHFTACTPRVSSAHSIYRYIYPLLLVYAYNYACLVWFPFSLRRKTEEAHKKTCSFCRTFPMCRVVQCRSERMNSAKFENVFQFHFTFSSVSPRPATCATWVTWVRRAATSIAYFQAFSP